MCVAGSENVGTRRVGSYLLGVALERLVVPETVPENDHGEHGHLKRSDFRRLVEVSSASLEMSHFERFARLHAADVMERHSTEYASVRPLLTVPELARTLKKGRTSIYRLVHDGSIRAVIVGETLRFRPEDVEAYLERDRAGP
jgi:excisionase family DNA binding protein